MSPSAAQSILVLGGAYAGLAAVKYLQEKIAEGADSLPVLAPAITILDERDGVCMFPPLIFVCCGGGRLIEADHTVGTPLAHTSAKVSRKAWKPYTQIDYLQRENVRVLRGKVENVDPTQKIATYLPADAQESRTLKYDYLIVSTGIRRPWPVVPKAKGFEEFLGDAHRHISRIQNSEERIVVVGGGKFI